MTQDPLTSSPHVFFSPESGFRMIHGEGEYELSKEAFSALRKEVQTAWGAYLSDEREKQRKEEDALPYRAEDFGPNLEILVLSSKLDSQVSLWVYPSGLVKRWVGDEPGGTRQLQEGQEKMDAADLLDWQTGEWE